MAGLSTMSHLPSFNIGTRQGNSNTPTSSFSVGVFTVISTALISDVKHPSYLDTELDGESTTLNAVTSTNDGTEAESSVQAGISNVPNAANNPNINILVVFILLETLSCCFYCKSSYNIGKSSIFTPSKTLPGQGKNYIEDKNFTTSRGRQNYITRDFLLHRG
jgi:hypothetical protein